MKLVGQKVTLRPVRMDDAPRFVKWFNDPSVNKFLMLRQMKLAEEKKWIRSTLKSKTKDGVRFCIETKDGVHIGVTGLDRIHPRNRNAEFGIMIGDKNYWSHGYGEEASRLIIDYGFRKLKLHRIYLHVYDYNKRAMNLYKKLGFKKEGILREANYWSGKFRDAIAMVILAREWKNNL